MENAKHMAAPLALLPGRLFKDMVQDHESKNKVQLKLKRDRQIENKNELNRLQTSLEGNLTEMEHIEETKTMGASIGAYVVGLLGTACMGVAVFSYLAANLPACIGFAIPGFSCWILSAVVYMLLKQRRECVVDAEIEQKYDEVNDICMKAHELVMSE